MTPLFAASFGFAPLYAAEPDPGTADDIRSVGIGAALPAETTVTSNGTPVASQAETRSVPPARAASVLATPAADVASTPPSLVTVPSFQAEIVSPAPGTTTVFGDPPGIDPAGTSSFPSAPGGPGVSPPSAPSRSFVIAPATDLNQKPLVSVEGRRFGQPIITEEESE